MAYNFPTDLPVNARPYHVQEFIDYLTNIVVPPTTVVLADLQTDLDQWVADIQDVTHYAGDPSLVKQYMDGRGYTDTPNTPIVAWTLNS